MAQYNKKFKLQNATCNDPYHKCLQNIKFEGGFAIATDGVVLVKNDLKNYLDMSDSEIESINGKCIKGSDFKHILSCRYVKVHDDGIYCINLKGEPTIVPFVDSNFPKYKNVIPNEFKDAIPCICLVSEWLKKVLDALYIDGKLVMEYNAEWEMIRFRDNHEENDSVAYIKNIVL